MTDAAAAQGFVSRFYRSPDGLKLHYREYAGPQGAPVTVICLPGLTRNARDFEKLAPHLATKYRVWCLEFRGRGLSEYAADPMTYTPPTYVRDLAALFKQTGLPAAALIGTSLGGLVSTIFTAVMPAKVLGVVLNDIGPDIDPAGLARIGSYVGISRELKNWEQAAGVMLELDGKIYPEYTVADWHRMARRRFREMPDGTLRSDYDLNIAKPFMQSATAVDLWPFFHRLSRVPSLVIRGGTSDLLVPRTVERMKAEIPGLKSLEVPNRGHTPQLDEPEALPVLDQFLAQLPHRVGLFAGAKRTLGAWGFLLQMKRAGVI